MDKNNLILAKAVLLFLIVLGIVSLYSGFPIKYYSVVKENADFFDPLFIMAVIKAESNFNHLAVSKAGAVGLMQIMPQTAEWLSNKYNLSNDLLNPVVNITLGIQYLKYLHDLYDGDMNLVLRAYNAGPRRIKEDPKVGETYVRKVKVYHFVYKVLYFWLR
ncbi:lytic transglycosylase domain-containing protein [Pseudothermotoga thermarum]|uniref:Lytic transglycosylase catalytic n=1 Tax=Pseudothermotoga thermarum DSM 5069 TaxID=688269 RepID=F7YTD6_9THEM|nr:lytic transglycosylase domain-containing protein [Pseudothermotoga thermarum]AEH50114.1 Lytic transglycosylase catalytic [Pseudothermotoga thermarum DSM 5069]